MTVLLSVLTCPSCGMRTEETMPTDACQFFWECPSCRTVSRPRQGDCCVYCSYGTVPCPPIQDGKACCS
ncbi:GDCCVxC domain-containing (seleno)protein [Mameliella sp. AT18]|uniref:GDCCVxC domain-containing (seleno)protein n=1 Tax=Mameliella sp. AT18 TaxID=3028385 RepID=UPI0009F71CBE|nr:GDCCVxC domain-containing (seleno)protein [Mameliella sp. AT18]MDD9729643.1 GDCCVxC domain-containing (seleno)protein [Mameliella sp. AT18]